MKTFYHGSNQILPIGTILTPRDDYENDWMGTDFYSALEKHRPRDKLAHRESVFMVADPDDIDLAGGGTEYMFTVEPIGVIHRHDLNWSSEISMYIGDGYDINSPEVTNAARMYWKGVPHPAESVWEYLTPRARIIKVEEY